MSSKRTLRKPEQVIRCLAEGESMLAAGKPAARCRKASLGSDLVFGFQPNVNPSSM